MKLLSSKIGLHWDAVVSYSGALLTINGGDNQVISEMKSLPNGCSEIRFEQHLLQAQFEINNAVHRMNSVKNLILAKATFFPGKLPN